MTDHTKINVLIADDHHLYREGLKMLLARDAEIVLAGEASDGKQLLCKVKELKPDVILTDLIMPGMDGVQVMKEIFGAGLPAKFIAVSTYDSDYLIIEALEAGASGYINKNAANGEIIDAIKMVHAGEYYFCKSTSVKLAKKISQSRFNPYQKMQRDLFSEQEKEIIRFICREKTSEEIGAALYMSPRTVERIRSKMLEKAGIKTTVGLVVYAIKNGIYFIEG